MATTVFRLSLLLILLSNAVSDLCNPQDKKALLQIKKDLNSPYLLASWNPDADCCTDWYTVECDPNTHRINSLTIFDSSTSHTNFSAQIPPSIGLLPYLETLVFKKLPNLTGPLQPAIAKLTNLKFLRISNTNLSGPVPSFLTQLTNLTFLDLSFNNLTGSIPGSLSQLPKLAALHLDRNHLTGSIPSSFGSFKSSLYLYLSHNLLNGSIPTSFVNLNLQNLNVSYNRLCGEIPVGGKLQSFDVYEYFHNKCLCGSPLPNCT
ncbi:polygalacturonase inhibitor-like [Vicia villosa]|uniref:polygalacturonase inhibitor-like n=1 Tax=Vicia villosa TaxID=3911 RepID=UPI00273C0E78|nr:polygalacturonase inhibitor-like [Vicia villosa]